METGARVDALFMHLELLKNCKQELDSLIFVFNISDYGVETRMWCKEIYIKSQSRRTFSEFGKGCKFEYGAQMVSLDSKKRDNTY